MGLGTAIASGTKSVASGAGRVVGGVVSAPFNAAGAAMNQFFANGEGLKGFIGKHKIFFGGIAALGALGLGAHFFRKDHVEKEQANYQAATDQLMMQQYAAQMMMQGGGNPMLQANSNINCSDASLDGMLGAQEQLARG